MYMFSGARKVYFWCHYMTGTPRFNLMKKLPPLFWGTMRVDIRGDVVALKIIELTFGFDFLAVCTCSGTQTCNSSW